MRKNSCSSLNGSINQSSSSSKASSWISASINNVAKVCYVVDSSDDSEDYYKPAQRPIPTCSPETIDAELGLTEDHFSCPEGYFGLSTIEELEMAIENCSEMIMRTPKTEEKHKMLVDKLVQLRYLYQDIKDSPNVMPKENVMLGHYFELGSSSKLRKLYCEKCCGIIWAVVQNWMRCKNCGLRCHNKCINLLTRVCALSKVSELQQYILDICPERSLSEQRYRCAECKRKFDLSKDADCLPRLCEYNGLNYCAHCHWNNTIIIPARVIHNWDFEPRQVCRASLQFLRLMIKKPVLNVESLNPALFGFVSELSSVKKLREDLLIMKQYFVTCHSASSEKLLLHLKDRQHFVEGADIYSLQDLIDVLSGDLLEYLEKIRSVFIKHITETCQGCRGKGFICEFCKSDEILFPFNIQTCSCPQCNSLFHKDCHQRWEGKCPKCARRTKCTEVLGDENNESLM